MDKLTIVTTTYNQRNYIGQAIESFLMQKTNFPFKIVISDDCSTDDTKLILDQYKQKYPEKIEIIENEKNLGAMGNFINTLSKVTSSEYVALCDGDDFWTDENKLQEQIDFLDNNKDFNICFHKTKLFYENEEKESNIIPQNVKEITTIEDLVIANYIVANSVVYRWKFNNNRLKDIFPNDIVPGDYYLHLMHAEDGKIKMINKVMSSYRRHKNGMWWEAENENKEPFILKYGVKFLKMYDTAKKNIKLPKDAFYLQKKDLIYNIIVTYIHNNKIKELENIMSEVNNEAIYYECMNDIINRNIWFLDYLKQKNNEKSMCEKLREEITKLRNELDLNNELFICNQNENKRLSMELESIKNSRWWKLRCKIKKE